MRHRTLILAALAFLSFVPFLGMRSMWYPDEPDVGEVGRAMYLSGDWIAPRRNGEIWVDYPPMVYWAGTISSHALGGLSEFSLRLPIALAAVALVALTCAVASRWLGPRAGLWAGLALLTFNHFGYEAICYRPDMLFSLAIGAGLVVYAAGAGERPRWPLRVAGFALLGLAMLAKGPLGLLLPGLVLTLWHGSRREWRRLVELGPLALVSLAIALPWFVACANAMGADNILEELYAQNIQRFYSGSRGHRKPPLYYLEHVWVDLAPWSLILPFALWWTFRSGRWRDRHVQLCLWWLGALLVFLSIAVTKRQIYLLPGYLPAAILLAPWLAQVGSAPEDGPPPDPRPARFLAAFMAALFTLIGLVALVGAAALDPILARLDLTGTTLEVAHNLRIPLLALGAVTLVGGLAIASAWRRGRTQLAMLRLAALQLPIYALVGAAIFPAFDPARTYVPSAQWIRERVGDEPRFGMVDPVYGVRKMGAFTFYSGVLVDHLSSEAAVSRYLKRNPGTVVLVNEDTVGRIFEIERADWPWPVVHHLEPARYRYAVLQGHAADGPARDGD